ncbi:MAG: heparan N-sulfatase [Bacteroides sp. SM23_62]|nr:MAG: heparan N-sulfatase [Bacteroides sp. SM23_62]
MNRKRNLIRAGFVAITVFLSASLAHASGGGSKGAPNVLLIIADDATYNDLPLYGGINVRTPSIDGLAAEGLTFNRAFLSMSMCVPCRAELYTGTYPVRSGVCWNHVPSRKGMRSIVQYLGELGYRTGLAGKVHADPREVFPFEMVEGFERNCVSETVEFDTREVKEFINRDNKQPFCLVTALVVPHIPWTVGDPSHFDPAALELPPYLADTKDTRVQYAKYLAEMEVLDQQVGELLGILEASGKSDNTMVIFTSEQGAQLPGCKWTNWNTGVHTAFIVRWPGKTKPGSRTDAMIQYSDVLPTLIQVTGGKVSQENFDGTSFREVLLGTRNDHRSYAYFMHNNIPEGPPYPIRAVTDGTYHYIRNLKPENIYIEKHVTARMPLNPFWDSWMFDSWDNKHAYDMVHRYMVRPAEELYCLDDDPNELMNLADDPEHRDALKELSAELDRWMKSLDDPGASLDSKAEWDNAREGRHFVINPQTP